MRSMKIFGFFKMGKMKIPEDFEWEIPKF